MIKEYDTLDWDNPDPYDLSFYYYLYEMLFERVYKSKFYLQNNLYTDSSRPQFYFGGDHTQMIASKTYMHSFFNTCRWIMFYHYKDDLVFNSTNFDFEFMFVKKHLRYAEQDILNLLDIDSFYLPKFQTFDDKVFFIKSCYKMLKACRYSSWTSSNYQFFTINYSGTTTWLDSWEDCKTELSTKSELSKGELVVRSESRWTWDGINPDSWHEEIRLTGCNRLYFKSLYSVFRPSQSVKMYFLPCNADYYNTSINGGMFYFDQVQEVKSYNLTADSQGFLTVDLTIPLDTFFPILRASASDTAYKINDWRYYPIYLIDNYNFYQYK